MNQIVTGYTSTIAELILHRDLKLGNLMVHFNKKTTYLMDMSLDEKNRFLENVDL